MPHKVDKAPSLALRLVFRKKAVSWNVAALKNFWTVKKIFNEWHEATYWAILEAWKGQGEPERLKLTKFPVDIEINCLWSSKRRHDVDSLLVKPIVDSLVEREILPDDNLDYVRSVKFTGSTGNKEDLMIVEIYAAS